MWRLLLPLMLAPLAAAAEPAGPFIEELARDAFSLSLPDSARIEVTFQAQPPEDVILISEFRMNPTTGQFIAEAVLPDGTTARLAGLASPLLPVPVPVRAIPAGSVLTQADVRIAEMHAARVGPLAVHETSDLLGMEARQALAPGRPVMRQAVAPPVIIERGDLVTLTFQTGALSLSVSARAMGSASAGQPIKVVNLSSNALVNAVADEPGKVLVPGGQPFTSP